MAYIGSPAAPALPNTAAQKPCASVTRATVPLPTASTPGWNWWSRTEPASTCWSSSQHGHESGLPSSAVAAGVPWARATSTAALTSQQMATDCCAGWSAAVGVGRWTVTVSVRVPDQFSIHTSLAACDVEWVQAMPAGTTRPVTTQPVLASGPPMPATRLDVIGSTSSRLDAKYGLVVSPCWLKPFGAVASTRSLPCQPTGHAGPEPARRVTSCRLPPDRSST